MPFINERYRRVLRISIPSAMHNFLNMVQGLIDMFFVGRISPASVAAVGVSMQYMGLLYAFMSLIYTGTNALVSRFFGGRDMEKAGQTIFMMLCFSFVISIPMAYIAYDYGEVLFRILNAGDVVVEQGTLYMKTFALGIPAMYVMGVLFSGMNAIGATKVPLAISITGNCLNVFLDWVFIFGNLGFKPMGIQGAALATVLVIYFQIILYLYVYFVRRKIVIIPKPDFSLLMRALKVGVPVWIERISTHPSYLFLSALVAKYGVDSLAGYQIGLRLEGMAFMPGVGFSMAGMALVGQGLGAGKPEESESDAIATVVSAGVVMGFMGFVMFAFAYPLAGLFADNQATVDEAAMYLRIMGFSQVPLAVTFVLSGCLRGAGDTKWTFYINTASLWGVRIFPAWVLSYVTDTPVWIYVVCVFEVVFRAFVLMRRFRKGHWKTIKV
ncbi:MATE efflux family protein [Denitrovibrio acetiphilus DSM 12809]|uniref:Multidrug-efflux transporter n=1 Tax=Denitrovibrio acetiphilus (strain DSM 12809 / NBRC 114555 / N2460) TaxID=522772 RepID=D4H0K7_DENA2|nr:MATE family efflux transporter [Denitrovibrio acetiphilus]ADD68520.1 MATE efflux family protein [Denitrovibrio acetiphilus DSM 12809]